jgi:hypothetical protein
VRVLDVRSGKLRPEPIVDPAEPMEQMEGQPISRATSPDGSRLLIAWPEADQWLFVPADGRSRVRAIGDIAAQFAPGHEATAAFPRVAGWCCRSLLAGYP